MTSPMAQSNEAFCMEHLGRWCQVHGIYEIRTVLELAAGLAKECNTSEDLAASLQAAAVSFDNPGACEMRSAEPVEVEPEVAPEEPAAAPPAPRRRTAK
jgi:hypothetical protein